MKHKKHSDLQIITPKNDRIDSKGYCKISTWVTLGMAVIIIIGCGYIMIVNQQLKKEQLQITKSLRELQRSFPVGSKPEITPLPDNLEVVLQDLSEQLQSQKKTTKALEGIIVSDLDPKVAFLLESDAKRQFQSVASHEDVTLMFVINVLKIAELYLSVFHDVNITNNLLTKADQLLIDPKDVVYVDLKAAIQQDKQNLTTMQLPAKVAILTTVNELLMEVDKYACNKPNIPELSAITTQLDPKVDADVASRNGNQFTKQAAGCREALKNTFYELKSLIKVKRNNTYISSVATVVNLMENLQRERLRFLLEQIRAAGFGGNNEHYHNLLITTKSVFLEHFIMEDPLNQQAITKLEALKEIQLKPMIQLRLNSLTKAEELLQMITNKKP